MASMNTCPEELRLMFVEHVHDVSPKSLDSLALVNKSFHKHVQNFRFQAWNFRHGNLTKDLDYIKRKKLQDKIRRVHLTDYMAVRYDFCMLLPKMAMLRDIEMVCGFGHKYLQDTILKYLRCRQEIRLHVALSGEPIRHEGVLAEPIHLEGFVGCQNLYSLSVKHHYDMMTSCRDVTKPLKDVLLTCPNLRHLKLDIRQLPNPGNRLMHYCGFGFVNNERIPAALETLEVIAYPFGKKDTHPHLFQPNIPDYPLLGYEQRYWTNRFDWSNLTRLNVRDTWAWIPHLEKLTSLKEVDFTSDPCTEFAPAFLRGVPTKLESIKVNQLEVPGWDTIVLHGSALRVLHIVGDGRQNPAANMTIEHELRNILKPIREGCPYIEDLGISFARDDLWPDEILREVAQFKRVRKVTLYFDYTNRNFNNHKLKPAITFKGASDVFKYLAVWSEGKEYYPFREVRLVSGIFRPLKNLYIVPQTAEDAWTNDSAVTIVCQTSERDDTRNTEWYEASCPDLTAEENDILDEGVTVGRKEMLKLVKRSLTAPRLKTVSPKFKLAWEGPVSYWQWQDYRNWFYRPGKERFFKGDGVDYIVEDEDDWHELRRGHPHPPFQH
ncbi:uncharacterized protein F4807DRAFT_472855 [Annulohypoxylon truncatum]|uniref:uncharacterized protein n=1 Tax=Annulohypoxylon truncatum TaxID=327061 RepID=UPI002007DBD3|nr:uncharacterized protein F4807DRAFT_472855 [Annulohypoxylon truncatum]KAI1212079.1 hypothetical protein F4807DRAFT_472855 [Annulohypoxylon truncatum]